MVASCTNSSNPHHYASPSRLILPALRHQIHLVELLQQIQTATAQQQAFIQAIENERQSQIAMTQLISGVANEMKDALTAVQEFTPELRRIARDMSEIKENLPKDLKATLFDQLAHQSRVAYCENICGK